MKIENLQEGMIVKNYKELAELLCIPDTGGNVKKKYLKELQRYIKYHQEGHRFIIDKIYNRPKQKKDNRGRNLNSHSNQNGAYGKYIRLLILNMLAQNSENMIRIGILNMLQELNMINTNYRLGNYNREKMAKYLGMDIQFIHEFYDTNTNKLQQTVERTLNKLMKNECLIFWSNIKMIGVGANYKERQATDSEVKFILNCENEILKSMKTTDKRYIYLTNKKEEFYNKLNKRLKEKGIKYSYNAYKIIFADEVYKKNEQLKYKLELEDEMFNKKELNNTICLNYVKSAVNRHNKAVKDLKYFFSTLPDPEKWGTLDPDTKIGISKYKRILADEDFIKFNKELVDICINDSSKTVNNLLQ